MRSIFLCEWERLWSKKSSILFFILIPFLVLVTALQSRENNEVLEKTDPQYSFWSNFPVMSIAEVFMLYFNIVAVLIIIMSFTHEYRTGQLRMVLQRSFRFSSVFWAKYFSVLLYLFLLVGAYFICSLAAGWLFFDSAEKVYLFFQPEPVSPLHSLGYSAAYFLLSYLSLSAVASVAVLVGVKSRSSTTAFAIKAGFLLAYMLFPVLLGMFGESIGYSQYVYFSLIEIQFSGIVQMLTDQVFLKGWILAVMMAYILLGTAVSLIIFSRRDSLH